MHSIRVKITAVTIAAILTSIIALGGIGILTIGMESDQTSVENMRLLIENTEYKLDTYMDSVEQSVGMAVHMADDSLQNLDLFLLGSSNDPEQKKALDKVMTAHCAEVEHAFTSIANNTNGVATYYYCINGDLLLLHQLRPGILGARFFLVQARERKIREAGAADLHRTGYQRH